MSHTPATRLTVLVVEDEPFVRMTIVEFLQDADFNVIEAASGEAAMALIERSNGVDVVFTDIQLGGPLSGWDVAEALRTTHPDVPVIYTSGAMFAHDRSVSGSVFLEKPYDPAAVLTACRTLQEAR